MTGGATRRDGKRAGGASTKDADADARRAAGGALAVPLEHLRSRHLAWTGFGLVLGGLLVWKFGTVFQWVGFVLLAIGAVAAYKLVRSLIQPPGTIVVGDDGVELPRGLSAGAPARFAIGEVRHAYLLRRAVPWTRAAPVLVIEAGGRAFTYPRDWFVTEADQRRIVRELGARAAAAPAADAGTETATKEAP